MFQHICTKNTYAALISQTNSVLNNSQHTNENSNLKCHFAKWRNISIYYIKNLISIKYEAADKFFILILKDYKKVFTVST